MVRIKNRYLLFNILYPSSKQKPQTAGTQPVALSFRKPTPNHIDAGRLVGLLRSQISLLFGDYGLGVSVWSLKVVYFSSATSTIILRVPRDHHRLVWAALTQITELPGAGPPIRGGRQDRSSNSNAPGIPCAIQVVRVSGTIRKAEEDLIRRARRDIVKAKMLEDGHAHLGSALGPQAVEEDISMQSIEDLSDEEDVSD